MKLNLHIQKFIATLDNKGYSQCTQRNYRLRLTVFAKWLRGKKITKDSIDYFRFNLSTKGLSKSSVNTYFIAIRSFLTFMEKQNKPIFSKDRVELAKVPDRQINFLTSSQVRKMLNIIKPVKQNKKLKLIRARDRAILELLFSCGLRVSELCNLKREQINLNREEFTIIGKGGRSRLVFLSDTARFWLKKYLKLRQDKYTPLFITPKKGKVRGHQIDMARVNKIVDKYARKAEIPMKVTCHVLRHAFASDLLRNGANLRMVQELLGHKNISTTQIYTHITNVELKEGFQKYHSGNFDIKSST